MDVNKHIIDNLNRYLNTASAEYAILLFGEWGVGKTSFIDSFITNYEVQQKELNQKEKESNKKKPIKKEPNKKLIKISLFGLKATSEIDEKIFEAIHPILSNKYTKLFTNFIKGGLKFGAPITDNFSIDSDLSTTNFSGLFKKEQNIIIVLDDLERTDIPLKEVLGYINYLVEISDTKVILVANEDFIFESEYKEDYRAFKEKVIGKSFKIDHDIDNILNTLLKSSNDLLKKYSEIIKDVYLISGYRNLRLLKQTIYDFNVLLEYIDEKYLKKADFLTLLIKNFFILNIEAKQGLLNKEDLKKGIPFQSKNKLSHDQKQIIDFDKYSIHGVPIFTGELWVEIIFNFNFKNLKAEIKDLPFFKVVQRPKWLKLWHYNQLENAEFEYLVSSFQKDFNSLKIQDIHIYLHTLALMIFFYNNDLLNDNSTKIEEKVECYISKYANKKYSKYWKLKYYGSTLFNGTGYAFYNSEDKDFIKLKNKIIEESNRLSQELKNIDVNKQLISLIKKNSTKDLLIFFAEMKDFEPIFNLINPDDFINALTRAKNATMSYIFQLLHERYLMANSHLNSQSFYFYLKDELPFWQEISKRIDKEISETQSVKKQILKDFKQTIENLIKRLENNQPS